MCSSAGSREVLVRRVVSLLYADGKRVTFQYDAGGRRTTMADWDGTTTYSYSARGELTGKTEPTGLQMTMLYDSVGNRTTLTEPDGYSYTFGYDAANRPIRLRNPNAYVCTFQYDAAGRRTTLLDSTGITRVYQYDPVGRLTTQVDSNSGGTALVTFVDSYDSIGNRTGRNYNGVVTTWVYDAAYRLTGQQKSGQAATFVYDPAGHMTLKWQEGSSPLTMSYDAANRLTTSLQGASQLTTYGFDNNGNLTSEHCSALSVALTWTYDGENRCLTEERPSGSNHTYTYAPDGLRRSIHQGGSAEPVSFVWDGDDLLNDYIAGGVSVRYDVLDGEVLGHKGGANRYLYVPDPLGSVANLLDTSQTIAGTYVYWPYGEVVTHTGANTPMQFVGGLGYETQIVNRCYVRARYYRPDLGRWVTRDPISFAGGDWNLYGYARARPVTCSDPGGMLTDCRRHSDQPRIPCPDEVRRARGLVCDALRRAGPSGLVASGCVTGPKHAQCLLDWCAQGNIYCHPASAPECAGRCAFSCDNPGRQRPDEGVSLCFPAISTEECSGTRCADNFVRAIIHEVNGVCGQHHGLSHGFADACDYRADCLCSYLGITYPDRGGGREGRMRVRARV